MSIINKVNASIAISAKAKEVFSFILESYRENLKKPRKEGRKDCITILKAVLIEAYKMAGFFQSLPMRGEKITEDIKSLVSHGFCNQVNYYYPIAVTNKITTGIHQPVSFQTLRFDDFSRIGTVKNSRPFITAKILSLMDGYHAVLIVSVEDSTVIYMDNNEIDIFEELDGVHPDDVFPVDRLNHPDDVFPVDRLNDKISKYVSDKWKEVFSTKGTRYKTETILATLNLFDRLV